MWSTIHFPQTFFLSVQNIICCNYTCIVIKHFARKCIPRHLKLCIFIWFSVTWKYITDMEKQKLCEYDKMFHFNCSIK